jgi:hypothetical protein
MFHSTVVRFVLGLVGIVAILGVLRFKPWLTGDRYGVSAREELQVGFLPVT